MQLPNAIAADIKAHGLEKVAGVLARTLIALAHNQQQDIEFNSELGTVIIERQSPKTND